jgi:hypothetical protein
MTGRRPANRRRPFGEPSSARREQEKIILNKADEG